MYLVSECTTRSAPWSRGRSSSGEVGRVDEGRLDAVFLRQQLREQAVGRLIDDIGDNNVVAGLQEGEEHGMQRGDPAREGDGVLPVVENGELVLQCELVDPLLRVYRGMSVPDQLISDGSSGRA